MYNSNLEDILKKKINKIHQSIVFAKLEKNELENQIKFLVTYKDNISDITLLDENNIKNSPSYLFWKNQKLVELQEKYEMLMCEKTKSDEKCRILQHANNILSQENDRLKNEICNIKNNITII